ncbi:MAG: chorismate-binding protein, partial [Planctomycetales bacterium]|nr:chorismate-binding protein [Planctomycetales bacterium]
MTHSPDFSTFESLARDHQWVPLCRRLLCDSLTPVSAFHRLDTGGSACLFESVIGGEKVGRYSFLAVDPFLELSARRQEVTIRTAEAVEQFTSEDPLNELRDRIAKVRVAPVPGLENEPFIGGAIGYGAYDIVRYTERLPNAPEDDRNLPDLAFGFYDSVLVFDNVTKTLLVIVLVQIDSPSDLRATYAAGLTRLNELVEKVGTPRDGLDLHDISLDRRAVAARPLSYTSNFAQEDFEAAVRKCVEYIRAGDIFQVVISQRLRIPVSSDPFDIYRTLRVVN